jgi:hypothetical protein
MKRTATIILAVLCSLKFCFAQTEKPMHNAVSFEFGKTGLLYNVTFDHKKREGTFGFRFGAGSNFGQYLNAISFGGGGYYLVGRENHFFELGMDIQYLIVDETSNDQKGFSFVYPDYSIKTLYPSINAGYRSYGKRTLFRIGVSPGLINNKFVPGGYISYGFAF